MRATVRVELREGKSKKNRKNRRLYSSLHCMDRISRRRRQACGAVRRPNPVAHPSDCYRSQLSVEPPREAFWCLRCAPDLAEQSWRGFPQSLPLSPALAHGTLPRMNIASVCTIYFAAVSAAHLINNLSRERSGWKTRSSDCRLPILVHKTRRSRPSIRVPASIYAASRFAAVRFQFHPSNLTAKGARLQLSWRLRTIRDNLATGNPSPAETIFLTPLMPMKHPHPQHLPHRSSGHRRSPWHTKRTAPQPSTTKKPPTPTTTPSLLDEFRRRQQPSSR